MIQQSTHNKDWQTRLLRPTNVPLHSIALILWPINNQDFDNEPGDHNRVNNTMLFRVLCLDWTWRKW